MTTTRTTSLLALGLVAALAAAGCSSGSDSSGTSSQPSGTSAPPAASAGSASTSDASSAPASGDPIRLGFMDPNSGAVANPGVAPAAQAVLEFVNSTSGGVNGRPIEYVTCDSDGTPEKNVACANDFVEKKVVAVIDADNPGTGAALPILHDAGIPVVGDNPQYNEGNADLKTFYIGPPGQVFILGAFQSFKDQGYTSLSLMNADTPTGHQFNDALFAPTAASLGLKYTPVYYDASKPDFGIIAAGLAATGSEVTGTAGGPEGQCAQLITSLRETGYTGKILAGACTGFRSSVSAADAAGVQIYTDKWLPASRAYAPDDVKAQLDQFTEAMTAAGHGDVQGYYSVATFSVVATVADVLRSISGPIDAAAVTTAMQGWNDKPSFLGPTISCDHSKYPKTSACTNEVMIVETQPDGSFKPVGGGFITVAPPSS
ncbi:MAG: ABC transporter substrate-binding protein [Ilumatobacteraceae bacterium]